MSEVVNRRTFLALGGAAWASTLSAAAPPDPLAWVGRITCMTFGTPGEVDALADMGAEVLHTNLVWPYYPLRRNGGGLPPAQARALRQLVRACQARRMKLVLGLPPFMPVHLARKHPNWREHHHADGRIRTVAPVENDLGTRAGCNLGPWGDYLIDVCVELAEDFQLDGYSFDGNYHPPLCHCPACHRAYRKERDRDLPPRADLREVSYREYLVWRGEHLVRHYQRLKERLRAQRPGAALMSWTVNAGRYGHLLHSPRAMPVELNRVFDLPMQEWWLDETNLGGSIAPAFGAAYLRAVTGDGPCASEPYLMARGRPAGTDSFPVHERLARAFLALTHGNVAAHSAGWPGHRASTGTVFRAVQQRARWLTNTRRLEWGALLVSEPTRQFVRHADIPGTFLPHIFGAFRAVVETHLPVSLCCDADVTPAWLRHQRVLLLPGAAALSDRQAETIRAFVHAGGGLVATADTSLFDELGRPRKDFALASLFGVSYRGQAKGDVARLSWSDHDLFRDAVLSRLVPERSVHFRGPSTLVSEPAVSAEVLWRFQPETGKGALVGAVVRRVGKGRVVYLATALDAGLWSAAYPYQRRLLARILTWAAGTAPPVQVEAPMCVQAGYYRQGEGRTLIHLFNNLCTTAHHGKPGTQVPLREETIPIHDISIRFTGRLPNRCRLEPDGKALRLRRTGTTAVVTVPRLDLHAIVVAEG